MNPNLRTLRIKPVPPDPSFTHALKWTGANVNDVQEFLLAHHPECGWTISHDHPHETLRIVLVDEKGFHRANAALDKGCWLLSDPIHSVRSCTELMMDNAFAQVAQGSDGTPLKDDGTTVMDVRSIAATIHEIVTRFRSQGNVGNPAPAEHGVAVVQHVAECVSSALFPATDNVFGRLIVGRRQFVNRAEFMSACGFDPPIQLVN